jgi:DNA-binding MarR family transcriptional regulator
MNSATATDTLPQDPLADGPVAEDPLALQDQVCFALVVAARAVVSLYKPILEPMGLTHPQYLVMLALWEGAPLSVTRLGELLQLDPATLSPLLKRLEAAGFISRARDARNERQLAVTLTDAGLALRKQALQVPPAVIEALGADRTALVELHGRLTELIAQARP